MAEYIEREAAYEKCGWYNTVNGKSVCAVRKDELAALPAADVAPVVHSKWDTVFFQRSERELASYTHVCPMCKFLYRNLQFNGYNYCPNCGAKMED